MLDWFGRKLREMQEVKRDERGFTLIELLVVVIIIGILAAIAIPTFLSQRANAQDATAISDLRNAASHAESYSVAQGGSYENLTETILQTDPYDFQVSSGVTGFTATGTDDDFTINMTSASTTTCRYVKSANPQVGCGDDAPGGGGGTTT